ncbi:hypothetical protein G6F68_017059 [Rhizopus microsporus]|nr:hypothetical protein G6F68_017059 [Rhizopus microsporus]
MADDAYREVRDNRAAAATAALCGHASRHTGRGAGKKLPGDGPGGARWNGRPWPGARVAGARRQPAGGSHCPGHAGGRAAPWPSPQPDSSHQP